MSFSLMNEQVVCPGEHRFDPLRYEDAGLSCEDAIKAAKADRQRFAAQAQKEGYKAKMWRLDGQLRQYASYGVPDGRIRTVYYVTLSFEE